MRLKQLWKSSSSSRRFARSISIVAGFSLLLSSILPWVRDPLGAVYNAWQLPIDVGWQCRFSFITYGLLCLCCSCFTVLVALARCWAFKGHTVFQRWHKLSGFLCLLPVLLFLWQYLWVDVGSMALFASHESQVLLIQKHFGYHVAAQLIPLHPFEVNISELQVRLQLLLNLISYGLLVACVSSWIMIVYGRLLTHSSVLPAASELRRNEKTGSNSRCRPGIIVALIIGIIVGRAPAGMFCEERATFLLTEGDYISALDWLDRARFLNPAVDQLATYHSERGQALYFLASMDKQTVVRESRPRNSEVREPKRLDDDSRAYLAAVYRAQGDDLGAYLQLQMLLHQTDSWVVDVMSATLEHLAETSLPSTSSPTILSGTSIIKRTSNDTSALMWLNQITQVEPSNVYASYMLGRLQCDVQAYTSCLDHMMQTLRLSPDGDVRSSAYTYMALSDERLGDYVHARNLLFAALALDPNYHNNTAREELSGLH